VDGAAGVRTACCDEGGGGEEGTGALTPYGEVPVELWMLIFGFCRRDVPVQHAPGNNSAAGVEEDACIAAWN
jgi:hypothetical protein